MLLVAVGLVATNAHGLMQSFAGWGHAMSSLAHIPIVAIAIRRGVVAGALTAAAGAMLHVGMRFAGDECGWAALLVDTALFLGVGVIAATLGAAKTTAPSHRPREASALEGSHSAPEAWQTSMLTRVIVGLVRQFGTPVASIEGAGWMLEDSQLPEEKRREFVGIVRKESHRLSRILSDVLAFTRPREPLVQQLDIATQVDEVIHLAAPKDRGPAIFFEKDIPPDLPHIRGDAEQVRQALLNVVLNAVQASPSGGRIEISARVEGNNCVIAVQDAGTGIPEVALGRIFEPFFTTHEGSMGLGLTVAQRIFTEHGGKITVDQSTERGTRVSIVLPVGSVRNE